MLVQGDSDRKNGDNRIHVLEMVSYAIVGGMERYVEAMIKNLPSDEFRFSCIAPYESAFTRSVREAGCEVYITPLRDDPTWHSIQLTVDLIRRMGVHLIHAHLVKAHTVAGIAGSITGIPATVTVHGSYISPTELGINRTTHTGSVLQGISYRYPARACASYP
jgi:hypothetical protein